MLSNIKTQTRNVAIGCMLALPVMVAGIVAHEAGHALASLSLGYDIKNIEIGEGRKVIDFKIGTAAVTLNAVPLKGFTLVPEAIDNNWHRIIIFGSGPLASFIFAYFFLIYTRKWSILTAFPLVFVSSLAAVSAVLGSDGSQVMEAFSHLM